MGDPDPAGDSARRGVVAWRWALVGLVLLGCSDPPRAVPARSVPERSAPELPGDVRALALAPSSGDGPADRALAAARAAVEREPRQPLGYVALGRAWIQKARASHDPGFYLHADAAARAALLLEPGAIAAENLRGIVLLERHDFTGARALAEGLVARAPHDAMALGTLADARLELGDLEGARSAVDRMLAAKPNLAAYGRAAYLRWLTGDAAGAKEAARLAVEAGRALVDPEPLAWALVQAALLFWHEGDLDGALAGLDLAEQASPGYAPAALAAGRVLLAKGDAAGAIRRLEVAFDRAPGVEAAWLLGDARAAAGDAAGAARAHAELERLGREDPRTFAAYLAATNQRLDLALELASAEVEKRPGIYTLDVHSFVLHRLGRSAEALTASRRAIQAGTPDASLWYHHGAILLGAGDARGGRSALERALALNPRFDGRGAAEARRLLGR